MFRFLSLAVVLAMAHGEITDYYPQTKKNLTMVTWEHAVNNATFLNQTLKRKEIMMIEADVLMGTLEGKSERIPIMAHPPSSKSDLSLQQFILNVTDHNKKNPKNMKGMKLDFKSLEAFQQAIPIIQHNVTNNSVLWLNADILKGPVNSNTEPVEATKFLEGCKSLNQINATLSLGWTTTDFSNKTVNESYTEAQITQMIETVKNLKNNITFPIRAMYAKNATVFKKLLGTNRTLTIWSGVNDTVDVKKLEKTIKTIGVDKIYLDVPKNVSDRLNLRSGSTRMSFGVVTVVTALLFTWLYNRMMEV